jgi:GT2 family glycosyltransferase
LTVESQKTDRMETISVVILSFNRREELESNLRVLLGDAAAKDFQVIVVDNDSSDGSAAMVESLSREYGNLRLVHLSRNMGLVGRNEGYRKCTGNFIVSLDDDTQITAESIQKVPKLFERHANAGLITFRMKHPVQGNWENPHGEEPCEVATVHGAGYAFRKSFLDTVGYLDEKCFWGGEELDYSIRCHAAGFRTIYVPDIVALHNSRKRSGADAPRKSLLMIYNYTRVLHKHFPRKTALLFSMRYSFPHINTGVRGSVFFPFKAFWAWYRGRRDGIAEYKPVPESTLQFFISPTTQPAFGNVPLELTSEIRRKFGRLLGRR